MQYETFYESLKDQTIQANEDYASFLQEIMPYQEKQEETEAEEINENEDTSNSSLCPSGSISGS